jgi:hypothetical protein
LAIRSVIALEKATDYSYLKHGRRSATGSFSPPNSRKSLNFSIKDAVNSLNDVVRRAGDLPRFSTSIKKGSGISQHTTRSGRQFTSLGPSRGIGKPVIVPDTEMPDPQFINSQSHLPKVRTLFSFEEFYQHEKVK